MGFASLWSGPLGACLPASAQFLLLLIARHQGHRQKHTCKHWLSVRTGGVRGGVQQMWLQPAQRPKCFVDKGSGARGEECLDVVALVWVCQTHLNKGGRWELKRCAVGYIFGLLDSRTPRPNLSKRDTTLLLLMLQRGTKTWVTVPLVWRRVK